MHGLQKSANTSQLSRQALLQHVVFVYPMHILQRPCLYSSTFLEGGELILHYFYNRVVPPGGLQF